MALPDDSRARASRLEELCAQADTARRQSRSTAQQLRSTWQKIEAEWQHIEAGWRRAERVRELWLSPAAQQERLEYSAHARMQARLASMPLIEQAKGIIIAESGFTEDQAFDALRRASQRSHIRVRDLAATIVARTAGPELPP
jgi:hypothetical protein